MFSNQFNAKPLIDQFKTFTTFHFIYNAASILEKIFWALLAVSGTLWIGSMLQISIKHWNENPILITKSTKQLSELTGPAVTFCSKGMSEYTLVERLGNYLDPKSLNIPEEIFPMRAEALKNIELVFENNDACYVWYWDQKLGDLQENCCGKDEKCKVKSSQI